MPRAESCGRCLRHPPAFDAALAAFEYRFPLDRVVLRFKFAGDLAAGRWLASQLAHATREATAPDLFVVPPSDASRLRARGFNPALEIARVLGAERGVRVDPWIVARVRATAPQPGLGGRARRANLRGAFACRRALDGAHVVIVDDVMTTGATVDALACALKSAGARRVDAWVVARTPEPRD
jgi:ComF family protein